MIKKIAAPLLLLTCICSFALAKESTIAPKGVYATIDTKPSVQAISILRFGTDNEKAAAAMMVESNSDKYCPAVFFILAGYLFEIGKTDDALFWLYAGRIRTQYDIKICADKTVMGGYVELNNAVPDLLKLVQFEDIENTKKIVEKAIKWDKETPINYDPRWIALHGMDAVHAATNNGSKKEPVLTIPKGEWKDVAENNRKEYWDTFLADINNITPEQFERIREKVKILKQAAIVKHQAL